LLLYHRVGAAARAQAERADHADNGDADYHNENDQLNER